MLHRCVNGILTPFTAPANEALPSAIVHLVRCVTGDRENCSDSFIRKVFVLENMPLSFHAINWSHQVSVVEHALIGQALWQMICMRAGRGSCTSSGGSPRPTGMMTSSTWSSLILFPPQVHSNRGTALSMTGTGHQRLPPSGDQSKRTYKEVGGSGERWIGLLGACPTSETDAVLSAGWGVTLWGPGICMTASLPIHCWFLASELAEASVPWGLPTHTECKPHHWGSWRPLLPVCLCMTL